MARRIRRRRRARKNPGLTTYLLIGAGLGVGYYLYKKSQAATAAAALTAASTTATGTEVVQGTSVQNPAYPPEAGVNTGTTEQYLACGAGQVVNPLTRQCESSSATTPGTTPISTTTAGAFQTGISSPTGVFGHQALPSGATTATTRQGRILETQKESIQDRYIAPTTGKELKA